MNYVETELPVTLDEQRELSVLLEAGVVLTPTAGRLQLHPLTLTAATDVMLTRRVGGSDGVLQQVT